MTAAGRSFRGVKVFSATLQQDRERLGAKVTEWLAAHPRLRIVDKVVCQSSDDAFHCLTFVFFYDEEGCPTKEAARKNT